MKVCCLGLGYTGLSTAILIARNGIEVTGVDINPEIVRSVREGKARFLGPQLQELLREVVTTGQLKVADSPEVSDAYFMIVPTFLNGKQEPDISYLRMATLAIIPLLKENDLYVIISTSPLGTTVEMSELIYEKRPELQDKIFVAYCPEHFSTGDVISEVVSTDRIIGGINPESASRAVSLFRHFVQGALHQTDCKTAEICSLTENAFSEVHTAFANELSVVCDKAGVDVWELIDLANTNPRVHISQPDCGSGGYYSIANPYAVPAETAKKPSVIAESSDINAYKSFWCVTKVQNEILRFELQHRKTPVVAMMGLTAQPNRSALYHSAAQYIVSKITQRYQDMDILLADPNLSDHPVFHLTDYQEAYEKADIIVFLVAHKEFSLLPHHEEKTMLDFVGVLNHFCV